MQSRSDEGRARRDDGYDRGSKITGFVVMQLDQCHRCACGHIFATLLLAIAFNHASLGFLCVTRDCDHGHIRRVAGDIEPTMHSAINIRFSMMIAG
jgi:hypothetical protein